MRPRTLELEANKHHKQGKDVHKVPFNEGNIEDGDDHLVSSMDDDTSHVWKESNIISQEVMDRDLGIEDIFASTQVPPWWQQIALRGLAVSAVMGGLFCIITHKLSLTTGVIPSLNVAAGLVGFFLVKTWTKFLGKFGVLKKPFTRQENTVIQTCVVACYGIAFSGGFGTYILGMDEKTRLQTGPNQAGNTSLDVKNPQLSWLFAFIFTVSFLGLFSVVPLRKWEVALRPLSSSTPPTQSPIFIFTEFIFTKHFNIQFIIVNISLLLGGIISWGLMWPLISNREGDWYPAGLKPNDLKGLYGYKVFIAIALILGDGLYNFVKIFSVTMIGLYQQNKKERRRPLTDSQKLDALETFSSDEQRRNEMFMKDRIPFWAAASGYLALAAISVGVIPKIFSPVKWYYVLVGYIVAPVLGFCNAYGCGLTDWSLASNYGKLGLFIFAAWAGNDGGVIAGLALCGVMMVIVATASDLMQDFKTGYLTLSSPRSMFASQIVGTLMGCILAPLTFWMFWAAFDIGNSREYPAPYAVIYRQMALIGVDGFSSLPKHCLQLCYGFFSFAIVTDLIRDLAPKRFAQYIPIPMAMAIPFYIGPYFAIDMFIGTIIVFVWRKVNKRDADLLIPAVASGLICGDGIWTLPSALLALAKIKPPICMAFVSRKAAEKLSL